MARILDVAVRVRSGLAPGDPVSPEEAPLAQALVQMSEDLYNVPLHTGTPRFIRLRDFRSLRAFEHIVWLLGEVKLDVTFDGPGRDRQGDDIQEVTAALRLHGFEAGLEAIRDLFRQPFGDGPASLDELRRQEKPSGAGFTIIERFGGTGRETLKALRRLLSGPQVPLSLTKHATEDERCGPHGETIWRAVTAAIASVSSSCRPRSAWQVEVHEPEGISHAPPRPLPPLQEPATSADKLPPASPPAAPNPPGT
ncbi:MAG: hypothetical protein AAGD10_10480 [Myxococcota bacterium]